MEDFVLKRKIMQLIIAGFPESSVNMSSGIRKYLQNGLGGVFLTNTCRQGRSKKCNIVNPKQLKQLCTDLQIHASKPLFIAMDAQGGSRSPFNQDFNTSCIPNSASELGLNSVFETFNQSGLLTEQLTDLGINLNLGNSIGLQNGLNSIEDEFNFSADTDILKEQITSYIKGQNYNSNTLSVGLKDFPANKDNFLQQLNVLKTLVKDKNLDINTIQLSSNAFLNHDLYLLVNVILRESVGFDGLLIAQDFETSKLSKQMTLSEYVIKGLNSGINMFIISNNVDCLVSNIDKLVEDLVYAVYSNQLSEDVINKSLLRINAIKALKLKYTQSIAA